MTGKLDPSMTAEELKAYLQEQRTVRLPYDRWKNRMWLRLVPRRVTSWDFRKIPAAKARAQAAEVGGKADSEEAGRDG